MNRGKLLRFETSPIPGETNRSYIVLVDKRREPHVRIINNKMIREEKLEVKILSTISTTLGDDKWHLIRMPGMYFDGNESLCWISAESVEVAYGFI